MFGFCLVWVSNEKCVIYQTNYAQVDTKSNWLECWVWKILKKIGWNYRAKYFMRNIYCSIYVIYIYIYNLLYYYAASFKMSLLCGFKQQIYTQIEVYTIPTDVFCGCYCVCVNGWVSGGVVCVCMYYDLIKSIRCLWIRFIIYINIIFILHKKLRSNQHWKQFRSSLGISI